MISFRDETKIFATPCHFSMRKTFVKLLLFCETDSMKINWVSFNFTHLIIWDTMNRIRNVMRYVKHVRRTPFPFRNVKVMLV